MQGEWTESKKLRCWHAVETDADSGKRYVVVHLSEEGLPLSLFRVRRELSDERGDYQEQVQRGRYAMADILRTIASRITEEYDGISTLEQPLRSGRPEHLTLEAAEKHADWLRNANATVVGKLLIVVVDEVRRLREENATAGQTRESLAHELFKRSLEIERCQRATTIAEAGCRDATEAAQKLEVENAAYRKRMMEAEHKQCVGLRAECAEFGLVVDISDEVLKACNKQIAAMREEFKEATQKYQGAAETHIAQRDQYSAEAHRLRDENMVLRAARESVHAQHQIYRGLVQQLVDAVDAHSCGPLSHVRMRDCVNAAAAVRDVSVEEVAPSEGER